MSELTHAEIGLHLSEIRQAWADSSEAVRTGWPYTAPSTPRDALLTLLRELAAQQIVKLRVSYRLASDVLSDATDEIAEEVLRNLSYRRIPEGEDCKWRWYLTTATQFACRDRLRILRSSMRRLASDTEVAALPETHAVTHQDDQWVLGEIGPLAAFIASKVAAQARAGNRREEQFREICLLYRGEATWESLIDAHLIDAEADGRPDARQRAKAAIQTGHSSLRKAALAELSHQLRRVSLALRNATSPEQRAPLEADRQRYERWSEMFVVHLRERSVRRPTARLEAGAVSRSQIADSQEAMRMSSTAGGKPDARLFEVYKQVGTQILSSRGVVPAAPPWVSAAPDGDAEQGEGSAALRFDPEEETWVEAGVLEPALGASPFVFQWLHSGDAWALSIRSTRTRSGPLTVERSASRFRAQEDGSFFMAFGDEPEVVVLRYAAGAGLIVGTRSRQLLLQAFVKRLEVTPPVFGWNHAARFDFLSDEVLREKLEQLAATGVPGWLQSVGLAERYAPGRGGVLLAASPAQAGSKEVVPLAELLFAELRDEADWLESDVDPDAVRWSSVATGLLWKREVLAGLLALFPLLSIAWDGSELEAWDVEAKWMVLALPVWDGPRLHPPLAAAAFLWLEGAKRGDEIPWWFLPLLDAADLPG
jgi:hypothetical protein